MLHHTKDLYGHKLAAIDGEIGHVKDFYFDDKTWVIRYLVADTGNWLTGRLVLLSPHTFGKLDEGRKTLQIKLQKERIEKSPSIELHRPVSRQYEMEYFQYYGWPAYWDGGDLWGFGGYPVAIPQPLAQPQPALHHRDDKHLQSIKSVTGFGIDTADGVIGEVRGFMVDDRSWAIRQMVVETGHWYAGKLALIPVAKIDRVSYENSAIFVNLTKADIQETDAHLLEKAGV